MLEILSKRFGLENATHARTPMAANAKLTNDPSGEFVDDRPQIERPLVKEIN